MERDQSLMLTRSISLSQYRCPSFLNYYHEKDEIAVRHMAEKHMTGRRTDIDIASVMMWRVDQRRSEISMTTHTHRALQ